MATGIPNFGDGSRTIGVRCGFFPSPYFIIYDFTENPALRQGKPERLSPFVLSVA